MGSLARILRRIAAVAVGLVVLSPLLALLPAASLDRGPAGTLRVTAFPLALTALDPLIWDATRNSLIVAGLVTLGARFIGMEVARRVTERRFWGRPLLVGLFAAGVAIPPTLGTLGLRWLLEDSGWSWVESADEFGEAVPALQSFAQAPWAWGVWVWAALAWSSPLVALAAAEARTGAPSGTEDAARLAGASRRRAWRQLVWPTVRPDVARVLALVFSLTLLDPGPPLALGLRRTLASQTALAALAVPGEGQLARAAALALLGTLLAAAASALLRAWGGRTFLPGRSSVTPRPVVIRWSRTPPQILWLAVPAGLSATCLWGLVATGFRGPGEPSGSAGAWSLAVPLATLADPRTWQALAASTLCGLAVVACRRAGDVCPWLARVRNVPPLAFGVGTLALPFLLVLAATAAAGVAPLAAGLRATAALLDPDQTPWLALALGSALAVLPLSVGADRDLDPAALDAARVLGASEGAARRRLRHPQTTQTLLLAALGATAVAPGLVLAPTAATRPVGPAVLIGSFDPDGPGRAAVVACMAVALNTIALLAATRDLRGLARLVVGRSRPTRP